MKRLKAPYMYHAYPRDVEFKLSKNDFILNEMFEGCEKTHNFSFISMNDEFVELIDQHYAWLGKGVGFLVLIVLIVVLPFLSMSIWFVFFKNSSYIFEFFMVIVALIIPLMLLYYIFKFDLDTEICRPIILNRKTGKVYFYLNENKIIVENWKDVVWVVGESECSGGFPVYELRVHIVEKGILKDTFLIGYPMIKKHYIFGLWNFISTYMEQGSEKLYPKRDQVYGRIEPFSTLTYCHRMVGSKETYKDTWQAMRNIYAGDRIMRWVTFPLDLFSFIGRRILLRIRPIPKWPKQVQEENNYYSFRDETLNYEDNFKYDRNGIVD